MIKINKKTCIDCNSICYIFSNGRCKKCASKSYKQINKKRKPTGEGALFLALWKIRNHTCDNCLTHLGDEPCTQFFSHILGKGAHPELRLDPRNIQILCNDCHYAYDFRGKKEFEERKRVKIQFPM